MDYFACAKFKGATFSQKTGQCMFQPTGCPTGSRFDTASGMCLAAPMVDFNKLQGKSFTTTDLRVSVRFTSPSTATYTMVGTGTGTINISTTSQTTTSTGDIMITGSAGKTAVRMTFLTNINTLLTNPPLVKFTFGNMTYDLFSSDMRPPITPPQPSQIPLAEFAGRTFQSIDNKNIEFSSMTVPSYTLGYRETTSSAYTRYTITSRDATSGKVMTNNSNVFITNVKPGVNGKVSFDFNYFGDVILFAYGWDQNDWNASPKPDSGTGGVTMTSVLGSLSSKTFINNTRSVNVTFGSSGNTFQINNGSLYTIMNMDTNGRLLTNSSNVFISSVTSGNPVTFVLNNNGSVETMTHDWMSSSTTTTSLSPMPGSSTTTTSLSQMPGSSSNRMAAINQTALDMTNRMSGMSLMQ